MPISLKLLQEIVNYLETRPFKEVASFLAQVQAEYQASQQPKPEGESIADKAQEIEANVKKNRE